jgi:hypothetical protein
MSPINDPKQVEHYRELVREMMLPQEGKEYEFDSVWVSSRGWKVVPVESAVRLPKDDIPRLVSVLAGAGYTRCIAVTNEAGYTRPLGPGNQLLGDIPTCYLLSVEEADFREFNRQLGPFRSVLTSQDRDWAISCNEWYNLFAGKRDLVEALLGKAIGQARTEFLEFASLLAKGNTDEPLMRTAQHYAAL